jgi:hypothetical protein
MQRRMLAAHRDRGFPGLFAIRSAIPIPGVLDEEAFRSAWQLLIDRHETLRLRFFPAAEGFRCRVVPQDRPDLRVHDWRDLGPEEQLARTRDLIAAESASLTPDTETPLRLRLLRLADNCTLFLQLNHYLLLDGWSTSALTKELLTAYGAFASGSVPELPPAPALRPYLEWCAAQDDAATERYWRERLSGLAAPTPLLRRSGPCSAGYAKYTLPLADGRLSALRSLAATERLTVGSLLLAAWAAVLSDRNGGAPDVVFGVTAAHRPAPVPDIESVTGLLVNVLPLHVRIDQGATWLGLARDIQRGQLGDGEYPLLTPELLSALPAARYDHVLVFDNYPVDEALRLSAQALGAEALGSGRPAAQADWNVNQMEVPLRVDVAIGTADALIFSYDPEITDESELAAVATEVAAVLDRIAASPGDRVLPPVLATAPAQASA